MAGLHQLQADLTAQHHLAHTLEKDGWYGAFLFTIETSCHLVDNPVERGGWHGAQLFSPFIYF